MTAATVARQAVADRDGWLCHYCGLELDLRTSTAEHVVPQSWGGSWLRWNLVLACGPCNLERGDDLVACVCSHCVTARILWWNHHAPRAARERLLVDALGVDVDEPRLEVDLPTPVRLALSGAAGRPRGPRLRGGGRPAPEDASGRASGDRLEPVS